MKVPDKIVKDDNKPTIDYAIAQLISVIKQTPDNVLAEVRKESIRIKLEFGESQELIDELELLNLMSDKEVSDDFRLSMSKSMRKLDKKALSKFLGNIVTGILEVGKAMTVKPS